MQGLPLVSVYFGASITINSAHYQALKSLPECLRIGQLWCADSVKDEQLRQEGQEMFERISDSAMSYRLTRLVRWVYVAEVP